MRAKVTYNGAIGTPEEHEIEYVPIENPVPKREVSPVYKPEHEEEEIPA